MVFTFFTYNNFTQQFFQEPKEVAELIELPISELLKSKIKIKKLFFETFKSLELPYLNLKIN